MIFRFILCVRVMSCAAKSCRAVFIENQTLLKETLECSSDQRVKKPLRLNASRWMLCLDERCEVAPGPFAKLAFSQRVSERFQIGDAVDVETLKFGVGRVEMQRSQPQEARSQRFAQLKVVDAKQFQGLLNLGKQASFQLDSLRRDLVVNTAGLFVVVETNQAACNNEEKDDVGDVDGGLLNVPLLHRVPEANGQEGHEEERHQLANRIDHRRVA